MSWSTLGDTSPPASREHADTPSAHKLVRLVDKMNHPRDAPPQKANPLTTTNNGTGFSSGKPNPSFGRPKSTTLHQEASLERMSKMDRLFIAVAEHNMSVFYRLPTEGYTRGGKF
jgi:hypothetical protein